MIGNGQRDGGKEDRIIFLMEIVMLASRTAALKRLWNVAKAKRLMKR